MKQATYLILMLFALLLWNCADGPDRQEERKRAALEKEAQEPMEEKKESVYYPIPSPEQMFGFISDNGVSYSKNLMNPHENYQSYVDPGKKALNFGVYTADLAYSASYQDIETTLDLYKVVKLMGADLNIEDMMTEDMMNNMQSHLQDKDSLAIIAGQSYYQAVEYLESNGQKGKLALMSLGGWVESLYITVNAISDFDPESETAQRLADQKITFGNLYVYLRKNEEEVGVKQEIKDIQGIRSVFASLKESRKGRSTEKAKGGKLILGGGSRITISENQFDALKKAINEYRTNLIKI